MIDLLIANQATEIHGSEWLVCNISRGCPGVNTTQGKVETLSCCRQRLNKTNTPDSSGREKTKQNKTRHQSRGRFVLMNEAGRQSSQPGFIVWKDFILEQRNVKKREVDTSQVRESPYVSLLCPLWPRFLPLRNYAQLWWRWDALLWFLLVQVMRRVTSAHLILITMCVFNISLLAFNCCATARPHIDSA